MIEKDNVTLHLMARMLLENGANPDIKDRFGFVPLAQCVKYRDGESVKLLLEFGANPGVENCVGFREEAYLI